MKQLSLLPALALALTLAACGTSHSIASDGGGAGNADTTIVQSLFNDRNSNISEENIQHLLDGTYALPAKPRCGCSAIWCWCIPRMPT
ncbi:MAG TPA: hypothetical protein VNW04_00615, partial [Puia sp.]|nr:hypothetical protein [Puia sp.]